MSSSVISELRSGADQLAVRWKTLTDLMLDSLDRDVMVWIPVAPVPMTPTFLPAKSRLMSRFFGQREVWNSVPLKSSMPSIAGNVGADKKPRPLTKKVETYSFP